MLLCGKYCWRAVNCFASFEGAGLTEKYPPFVASNSRRKTDGESFALSQEKQETRWFHTEFWVAKVVNGSVNNISGT